MGGTAAVLLPQSPSSSCPCLKPVLPYFQCLPLTPLHDSIENYGNVYVCVTYVWCDCVCVLHGCCVYASIWVVRMGCW